MKTLRVSRTIFKVTRIFWEASLSLQRQYGNCWLDQKTFAIEKNVFLTYSWIFSIKNLFKTSLRVFWLRSSRKTKWQLPIFGAFFGAFFFANPCDWFFWNESFKSIGLFKKIKESSFVSPTFLITRFFLEKYSFHFTMATLQKNLFFFLLHCVSKLSTAIFCQQIISLMLFSTLKHVGFSLA